jgi:S1-C subfamily serine protease/Flp pilus assembly protein TadD
MISTRILASVVLIVAASSLAAPQNVKKVELVPAGKGRADLATLYKKVSPGVVTIIAYTDAQNLPSSGSGFFVAPNLLVTNLHVVERAFKVDYITFDNEFNTVTYIRAVDYLNDLVLLETKPSVTIRPPGTKMVLTLTKQTPEVGSPVITVSAPFGFSNALDQGIVSSKMRSLLIESGPIFQFTGFTYPGSSGCPVLNEDGEVVGVHFAQWRQDTGGASKIAAPGMNFAITAGPLMDMLATVEKQLPVRIPLDQWAKTTLPQPTMITSANAVSAQGVVSLFQGLASSAPLLERMLMLRPDDDVLKFHVAVGFVQLAAESPNAPDDKRVLMREKAESLYVSVIASIIDTATRAIALSNLAQLRKAHGDLKGAVALLEKAVQADRTNKYAWNNLSDAYLSAGDLLKADLANQGALLCDPKYVNALNTAGVIHFRRSEFRESVCRHREACELDPNYGMAWMNLGLAYEKLGKVDDALFALRLARARGLAESSLAESIKRVEGKLRATGTAAGG